METDFKKITGTIKKINDIKELAQGFYGKSLTLNEVDGYQSIVGNSEDEIEEIYRGAKVGDKVVLHVYENKGHWNVKLIEKAEGSKEDKEDPFGEFDIESKSSHEDVKESKIEAVEQLMKRNHALALSMVKELHGDGNLTTRDVTETGNQIFRKTAFNFEE